MATDNDRLNLSAEQIAEENQRARGTDIGAEDGGADRGHIEDRRGADAGEGADDVETRKPQLRAGRFQEKRLDIAAKARELRDVRNDPELTGDIAEHRARMYGRGVDQPDLRAEPDAPPAKRTLKVNGAEIELDDAQIIEHAQRSLAAGDILEQAKRDRSEANSVLQQLRDAKAAGETTPQADAPKPKPATPAPDTTATDDDLDDIIDKIQVGDPREAKEALKKFGSGLIEQFASRIGNLDETIARTVEQVNEGNQRKRDTASTLKEFSDENQDFIASDIKQAALAQAAANTMRSKMKALGVADETFSRLQTERGLTPIEATAYAYRQLESQGYDLPEHRSILKEAAATVRREFGQAEIPSRQTDQQRANNQNFNTQDRVERKRVMTPQPRRANSPSALDQQERSRDEVRLAAVRQMKAQRRGRA